MNALIIDDLKEKREEIYKVLKECEIDSQCATNEMDAKKSLKQKKYDIIILDMQLPLSSEDNRMNNYSGLSIMNSMDFYGYNIPTILVSIYSDFTSMKKSKPDETPALYINNHVKCIERREDLFDRPRITLKDIHEYFSLRYDNCYVGAVSYNLINYIWKTNLKRLVQEVIGAKQYENNNS